MNSQAIGNSMAKCILVAKLYMELLLEYRNLLEDYLKTRIVHKKPEQLYTPISYIMELGGKRLRPFLTLMAAECFGASPKEALSAATAVELFHNFSLIHDDIMDDAPLRRGKATVHEKWDVNTGILSGDAMLILAYQHFEEYPPEVFQEMAKLFSKTALEVCEGQQYDVDFEIREEVAISEYITMISYKTAVLVGAALQMGAIVAKTSGQNKMNIYEFGRNLGIAFQLQDDYLDAFGNPETFGKQVGGDILANKKTFLYIKSLQEGSVEMKSSLKKWYETKKGPAEQKIAEVTEIFEASGAARAIQQEIESYTQQAFEILDTIEMKDHYKEQLRQFGIWLMNRKV